MFKLRKYLTIAIMLVTLVLGRVVVYASEPTRQEGEIYQDDDGKYYQIINGRPFEIDNGSASDGSITDAFKDYSKTTTPDAEVMNDVNARVVSPIGTVISFIIYLIFAFTAFTTVVDLAWIALPPIRPFLYNPQEVNVNANVTRDTGWGTLANQSMAQANQRQALANQHQMNAMQLAQNSNIRGARMEMDSARHNSNMANMHMNDASRRMRLQNESDVYDAQRNQRNINNAIDRANNLRDN